MAGALSLLMSALGAAAMACGDAAAGSLPCRYEVVHVIQGPPCPFGLQPQTIGTGISPNGRYVCGFWTQCISGIDESFVFDTQTALFRTIPRPQGITASHATDVSDAGLVVGDLGGPAGSFGYIWNLHTQTYEQMLQGLAPEAGCWINAINASGTVCGMRGFTGAPDFKTTAFIWSAKGGFRDAGLIDGYSTFARDISDAGLAVGSSWSMFTDPLTRGLVFDGRIVQSLPRVPNGTNSVASGVNTDGMVLIGGSITPAISLGFVLHNGVMTQLPLPPGFDRNGGLEITTDGTILGSCSSSASPSVQYAHVWREAEVRSIQTQVPVGLVLDNPRAMSDTGVVVMRARLNNNNVGVVLRHAIPMLGDSNCDLLVNVEDLLDVIKSWGPCQSGCSTDFDLNNVVNVSDLMHVIESWDIL